MRVPPGSTTRRRIRASFWSSSTALLMPTFPSAATGRSGVVRSPTPAVWPIRGMLERGATPTAHPASLFMTCSLFVVGRGLLQPGVRGQVVLNPQLRPRLREKGVDNLPGRTRLLLVELERRQAAEGGLLRVGIQ